MIHELLRQYGEEQLEEADRIETTRDVHMRYYAEFMHKREEKLKRRRQLEAIDEIEADFENVRAAWRWALQQQHYETFDQMAFALTLFAEFGSRAQEGGELFVETVRQLTYNNPNAVHRWLLAKVQSCYAHVLMDLGQYKRAEPIVQESLAVLREHSDQTALTYCLRSLSRVKVFSGQAAEGRLAAEEHLSLSTEVGDTWEMAFAHYFISIASGLLGDLNTDYSHRLQSLALFSKVGDTYGKAWAHSRLGLPSAKADNSEEMFQHNLQAYQLFRKIGNTFGVAYMLNKLAAATLMKGDFDQAAQLAEESLAVARNINRSVLIASALLTLSEANENNGDYEAAHRLAQGALLPAQTSNNLDKISNAKLRIGLTLCCLDAHNDAIEYLCSALKTQSELGRTSGILSAIAAFIQIVAHRGQSERAVKLLGLIFQHPVQMAPLTSYPRLLKLRDSLQAELGEKSFNAAYERGNSLDLETVVRQLLDEFGEVG